MICHPFSFLRYLIDSSLEKPERGMRIAEDVSADEALEVVMQYDSTKQILGLAETKGEGA